MFLQPLEREKDKPNLVVEGVPKKCVFTKILRKFASPAPGGGEWSTAVNS